MNYSIVSLKLIKEQDLVPVRQRARQVAALAGFDPQDQTRIATAVSEIARNAYQYGGGGKVEFAIEGTGEPQALVVRISDAGPGIADLRAILQGRYKSSTGMGLGIQGARRLMDSFDVETAPGQGVAITMRKALPRRGPHFTAKRASEVASELVKHKPVDAYDELQLQNQELMRALEELRRRQEETAELNRELEETNRGVVALYAELDERAEHLKRADDLKSRFLSHMSHEFRTPLNSITALSQILLKRLDGPLNEEQEKQVGYIHAAAQELTEMVNDLLDLAKVEAGKIEMRPARWQLATLFGTLRGLMRPLVANSTVQLVIEEPSGVPELFTDETKVGQILRNLVSNAIKFTERGEVRVTASYDATSGMVSIAVSDTGIGIAPDDQPRIFDQYVQVDSPRQRKVRGTGLGLSLSRKLAGLLGGGIRVESAVGVGSCFTLDIPSTIPNSEAPPAEPEPASAPVPKPSRTRAEILVVDDEEVSRYVLKKQLSPLDLDIVDASGGAEGLRLARERQPDLIILDLVMPGLDGFEVLERLKSDTGTRDIPVVIHTSKTIRKQDRERLGDRPAKIVAKSASDPDRLTQTVETLLHERRA